MLHTDDGYILLDSLLSIFLVITMCCLCLSIYKSIDDYERGYLNYQQNSNERLQDILYSTYYCEACEIDESD